MFRSRIADSGENDTTKNRKDLECSCGGPNDQQGLAKNMRCNCFGWRNYRQTNMFRKIFKKFNWTEHICKRSAEMYSVCRKSVYFLFYSVIVYTRLFLYCVQNNESCNSEKNNSLKWKTLCDTFTWSCIVPNVYLKNVSSESYIRKSVS